MPASKSPRAPRKTVKKSKPSAKELAQADADAAKAAVTKAAEEARKDPAVQFMDHIAGAMRHYDMLETLRADSEAARLERDASYLRPLVDTFKTLANAHQGHPRLAFDVLEDSSMLVRAVTTPHTHVDKDLASVRICTGKAGFDRGPTHVYVMQRRFDQSEEQTFLIAPLSVVQHLLPQIAERVGRIIAQR